MVYVLCMVCVLKNDACLWKQFVLPHWISVTNEAPENITKLWKIQRSASSLRWVRYIFTSLRWVRYIFYIKLTPENERPCSHLPDCQSIMVERVHQEFHATQRERMVMADEYHKELSSHLRIPPPAARRQNSDNGLNCNSFSVMH